MKAVLIALGLASFVLAGCPNEDVGRCCTVITADAASAIPVAEAADGGLPRNLVAEHPGFDCNFLSCVSWQGSQAFCSRRCSDGKPCPDGFDCRPVLESDPGPGATITPTTTFCVRRNCTSDGDCPDKMVCAVTFQGNGTDETIRQCVKAEEACEM